MNNTKNKSEIHMFFILRKWGNLKNARMFPGYQYSEENSIFAPSIIWKYLDKDQEEFKALITKAVQGFKSPLAWHLEFKHNCWFLYPEKVEEVNLAHGFIQVDDGIKWLADNDPEFGKLANKEFQRFTEYLYENYYL